MNKDHTPVFSKLAEDYSFWEHHNSEERYSRISALLEDLDCANLTCVDIGCASGALCRVLSRSFYRIHGFDASAELIGLADKMSHETSTDNVEFFTANSDDLPLSSQSVDVAICYGSIHEMPLEATISEIRRLLKPGGRLIIFDYQKDDRSFLLRLLNNLSTTMRSAPIYLKSKGLATSARLLKFRLNPLWLSHISRDCFFSHGKLQDALFRHFSCVESIEDPAGNLFCCS